MGYKITSVEKLKEAWKLKTPNPITELMERFNEKFITIKERKGE